jgi:hypothetical protein
LSNEGNGIDTVFEKNNPETTTKDVWHCKTHFQFNGTSDPLDTPHLRLRLTAGGTKTLHYLSLYSAGYSKYKYLQAITILNANIQHYL